MSVPAVCCLLVDVDGFLSKAAASAAGWADHTRAHVGRIITVQAGQDPARVEQLPPDEWLVTLGSDSAHDVHRRAYRIASAIHRAVRAGGELTVTVAVGDVTSGPGAVSDAISSARQAHRSKLLLGPDRVISAAAHPVGGDARTPPEVHRDLAHAIGRGDEDRARRLLRNWFAAATNGADGNDELVRRWLFGQVLTTTAVLDGRLGAGTAADWIAVCEAMPYPLLADLADLHEPAAVVAWLDRVVAALAARHHMRSPRTSTLELVRRHVDEHYTDSRLRLKTVAREVGVSPFHISHLFRSDLGTTFRDYVTQRRVRRAQRLLEQTRLGMAEVASASGFTTPVQLRRVLLRETGTTPTAVRQSAKART